MLTPFEWLIIAHLIGDYLFQTSWMAKYKATKWLPLLSHVTVYTFVLSIIAWFAFGGLTIWGILIIFVSHVFLDQRGFVVWWVRTIMRVEDNKQAGWLSIIVDQIFHVLIIAVVVYFSL